MMPPRNMPQGGRGSRLTPEAKATVLEVLNAGGTVSAAAAEIGWSDRSIRREARRDREFWDALTDAMATGAALRHRERRNRLIAS